MVSSSKIVKSTKKLSFDACCSFPTVVEDNPSFSPRRQELVPGVNQFALSISDSSSTHRKVAHIVKKEFEVDSAMKHNKLYRIDQTASLNNKKKVHDKITTVGKRMFWILNELSGPFYFFTSENPMRHIDCGGYAILQCDNMKKIPYRCKGCCFMLFDGLVWNCCVMISATKDSFYYNKFKKNSLNLDKRILKLVVSHINNSYIFKFVNIFHPKEKFLKSHSYIIVK